MRISIEPNEKETYMRVLKRVVKVIAIIILIRIIRYYIRANAHEFEGIRELYMNGTGTEAKFVSLLLVPIIITVLMIIIPFILIKGRAALVHPFFIWIIIFLIADLSFVLIYPELFIAIFDTILFHGV